MPAVTCRWSRFAFLIVCARNVSVVRFLFITIFVATRDMSLRLFVIFVARIIPVEPVSTRTVVYYKKKNAFTTYDSTDYTRS